MMVITIQDGDDEWVLKEKSEMTPGVLGQGTKGALFKKSNNNNNKTYKIYSYCSKLL